MRATLLRIKSSYNLFGIFAIHSPESCPLNNTKNNEVFKEIFNKLQSNSEKYGVKNINGFYMSVLEHEWIIMLEATALMILNNSASILVSLLLIQ